MPPGLKEAGVGGFPAERGGRGGIQVAFWGGGGSLGDGSLAAGDPLVRWVVGVGS